MSYQILIESDNLPACWEKQDLYNHFGEVTEVNFVTNTGEGVQRLAVGFREDMASMMTGTMLKVPWDKYAVLSGRSPASLTLGNLQGHSF